MKTSLHKLQWMEDGLLHRAAPAEQTLFEARLLLDPALREDCDWQRKTYTVIREYGRRQFRLQLENLHRELFTAPQHRSFRERVMAFFGR